MVVDVSLREHTMADHRPGSALAWAAGHSEEIIADLARSAMMLVVLTGVARRVAMNAAGWKTGARGLSSHLETPGRRGERSFMDCPPFVNA